MDRRTNGAPGQRASTDSILIFIKYQELFALGQALPGPGSTKMLYSINIIHSGYLAGLFSFLIWRYCSMKVQVRSSRSTDPPSASPLLSLPMAFPLALRALMTSFPLPYTLY